MKTRILRRGTVEKNRKKVKRNKAFSNISSREWKKENQHIFLTYNFPYLVILSSSLLPSNIECVCPVPSAESAARRRAQEQVTGGTSMYVNVWSKVQTFQKECGVRQVQWWRSNRIFGKRRKHYVILPVCDLPFWNSGAIDASRRSARQDVNVAAHHEGELRVRGAVAEGKVHRQTRAKRVHWKGRREKTGVRRKFSFELFSLRKIPRQRYFDALGGEKRSSAVRLGSAQHAAESRIDRIFEFRNFATSFCKG